MKPAVFSSVSPEQLRLRLLLPKPPFQDAASYPGFVDFETTVHRGLVR